MAFVVNTIIVSPFSSTGSLIGPHTKRAALFLSKTNPTRLEVLVLVRQQRTPNTMRLFALDNQHQHYEDDYFDVFVKMRTGVQYNCGNSNCNCNNDATGTTSTRSSTTVFWAGRGAVYQAYSDQVLAILEGFDVSQGIVQEMGADGRPSVVRQLSRKLFWFRHPETNQVMHTYQGQPVHPIVYPYQAFDYVRPPTISSTFLNSTSGHRMEVPVVAALPKGVSGPRDVTVSPITGCTVRNDPNTLLFQAPVFCDLELPAISNNINTNTPRRRSQAWEFYDYNVDRLGQRPPTAVWCRQGVQPPFVVSENAAHRGVLRFVGSRVDQFAQLPASIQEFIVSNEQEYGLFRLPPVDMQEIQRLEGKAVK